MTRYPTYPSPTPVRSAVPIATFPSMSTDDIDTASLRTPLSLVIKTITTHCFALGSYAYTSSLLRRPTRNHIQALRLLFFLFVPTLPLVELIISASRSLLHYLRNFEDDDAVHFRYYLSAALGMHASLSQDDENKTDGRDWRKNMHLLNAGSHFAEKKVMPLDWVWMGKLLAALFSITQAIGTIVMWVRRIHSNEGDALSFDHRNGAMGIASTICGAICILTLVIRLNWKVSKAFEAPQGQEEDKDRNALVQFGGEALLAMFLHLGIACIPNHDNRWLYTSVGSIAFILTGNGSILLQGWQTLMLLIFVYIFRKDISRRLGLQGRFQSWFPGKRLYRVKALVGVLLALWIVTDLIRLLVIDIVQVVREAKHGSYSSTWLGYWWQDPLSDSLIVI